MEQTTYLEKTSATDWSSTALALLDTAVWNVMLHPMTRAWPDGVARNTRQSMEELAEVYGQKELIDDASLFFPGPPPLLVEEQHLRLTPGGGAVVDLIFPSAYEPFYEPYGKEYEDYPENHTVRARWFRSARPRATLLCLHGMGTGPFMFEVKSFEVERWLEAGLDVVILQLPFHGSRRPAAAPTGVMILPSPHLVRTNEGMRQAIWDIRGLMAWLRARGVPTLGVYGYSLGAYLGALLSTVVSGIDFLWLCSPPASFSHIMWNSCGQSAARRRAERSGATEQLLERVFSVHSPLLRPSLVPKERSCFLIGRGDRITPSEQVRLLWEHWGRPPLLSYTGGHVARVGRDRAHDELEAWLINQGIVPGRQSFTQIVTDLPRRIMSWMPEPPAKQRA